MRGKCWCLKCLLYTKPNKCSVPPPPRGIVCPPLPTTTLMLNHFCTFQFHNSELKTVEDRKAPYNTVLSLLLFSACPPTPHTGQWTRQDKRESLVVLTVPHRRRLCSSCYLFPRCSFSPPRHHFITVLQRFNCAPTPLLAWQQDHRGCWGKDYGRGKRLGSLHFWTSTYVAQVCRRNNCDLQINLP